ncbi:STAS domain-containing protein [Streptomyces sp. NPDC002057]|uniref:STAS domain-containing protein n=1 Tax=Streptomyces sp. NPDC002057 TaxID=3154664 RepID=UPI0033285580
MEIIGVLDHTTTPVLREGLYALGLTAGQLLTLDLSQMECCDSSGIGGMIAARNHAVAADAAIALSAVPAHTLRVLHVLGLAEILHVPPAPETATGPAPTGPRPTVAGDDDAPVP